MNFAKGGTRRLAMSNLVPRILTRPAVNQVESSSYHAGIPKSLEELAMATNMAQKKTRQEESANGGSRLMTQKRRAEVIGGKPAPPRVLRGCP